MRVVGKNADIAEATIIRPDDDGAGRVLVVEDHGPTREGVCALLERKDYRVTAVDSYENAREVLMSPSGPPIAVIDWILPDGSGLDLCRALRSGDIGHYVYVIIITAQDGAENVAEALAAGADDFIRKPFGTAELISRVRNAHRIIELERNLAKRIGELESALRRVKQLKRLLPACMFCKKIRSDSDYWQEIENYLREEAETQFSHGICPECMALHYPELAGTEQEPTGK